MPPRAEENLAALYAFYEAFDRHDAAAMMRCCHAEIEFSDPIFPRLVGDRVRVMWEMLCVRGKDLEIQLFDAKADEEVGSAEWEARYTFGPSGRPVRTRVRASFWFRDGLIVRHCDAYDLRAWAAQALGMPGRLAGSTSQLQQAIRTQAQRALELHIRRAAARGESTAAHHPDNAAAG